MYGGTSRCSRPSGMQCRPIRTDSGSRYHSFGKRPHPGRTSEISHILGELGNKVIEMAYLVKSWRIEALIWMVTRRTESGD